MERQLLDIRWPLRKPDAETSQYYEVPDDDGGVIHFQVLEREGFAALLVHGITVIERVRSNVLFADDVLFDHFAKTLTGDARQHWEDYVKEFGRNDRAFDKCFKRYLYRKFKSDQMMTVWKTMKRLYCPEDLSLEELGVLLVDWKGRFDWLGDFRLTPYRIKLILLESVDPIYRIRYSSCRNLLVDDLQDIVQFFVADEEFNDEEWHRVRQLETA